MVENDLCNKILKVFDDMYLYPLKNAFTGYSSIPTLNLIIHIYGHYARISATNLVENDNHLREPFNPNEPLESLYTRLNKCVDYATTASKLITKVQLVLIAYGIVA